VEKGVDNMKVLLAEDDLRLAELMVHMLKKKAGYEVDWVTNGKEAYEYAHESPYDVIIMDWMMPVEDGVQTCRRLRDDDYTGAILMLTARDTFQDRTRGFAAGANDYLTKPFEFKELLDRIRCLASQRDSAIARGTFSIQDILVNQPNPSE
jgi:DNA-binding response OmpR family regulator